MLAHFAVARVRLRYQRRRRTPSSAVSSDTWHAPARSSQLDRRGVRGSALVGYLPCVRCARRLAFRARPSVQRHGHDANSTRPF